jgi:hypothetical protein
MGWNMKKTFEDYVALNQTPPEPEKRKPRVRDATIEMADDLFAAKLKRGFSPDEIDQWKNSAYWTPELAEGLGE